jgi:predicted ATPase
VAAALEDDAAEIEEKCHQLARRLYFLHCAGEDELPDGSRSSFFAFAHELYREVLYRRQTAARRAKRHVLVAEKLGKLFQGREATVAREMAMHYEAAGDWQRGTQALVAAAGYARQRQAHDEAEELFEHALRMAENLAAGERDTALTTIRERLAEPQPAPSAVSRPRRLLSRKA